MVMSGVGNALFYFLLAYTNAEFLFDKSLILFQVRLDLHARKLFENYVKWERSN